MPWEFKALRCKTELAADPSPAVLPGVPISGDSFAVTRHSGEKSQLFLPRRGHPVEEAKAPPHRGSWVLSPPCRLCVPCLHLWTLLRTLPTSGLGPVFQLPSAAEPCLSDSDLNLFPCLKSSYSPHCPEVQLPGARVLPCLPPLNPALLLCGLFCVSQHSRPLNKQGLTHRETPPLGPLH